MGNEDLGNHYYSIGDLSNAVKAYSRMRDYCTTPAHIASTSFRIIQVAIEQGNWLAVQSQVHKIRNLQMKTDDAARSQPKIQAAMGLYQMCTGEYRDAATSFLASDPSLTDTYNEILSSNDVAVYGGLCALASMDRHELQTKVLENASFRNFLELEPHIRRAISFFCSSKYAQCLDILDAYRADYLLDIYLQAHVPNIYRRIRTKSIVQYFAPFSRVTLDAMAQTFGTTATPHPVESASQSNGNTKQPQSIEVELISLIEKGILNAKIDLEARVLVAKESNVRADVHSEAQDMVKAYIRETRMRLLRINAINAGLEIKAPQKSGKQHMNMDPMDSYQYHQQDQHQTSRDDMRYSLGGEQVRGLRGGGPNAFTGKARML
jgi:COP9 signalosome complex subunit 1